jgi:hypothetical protein
MLIVFRVEPPVDLEPGTYTTKVVSAEWKDGKQVVTLDFVGAPYTKDSYDCLFPITKEAEV